ncbi:hypothetical protein VNO77_23341 [Canavalia gladiata]|uniref:Uncharacterized protein n=1 Tax=Canavalia gladiata TaxID=3824 RepID=A0AAN9L536_CANGL
MSGVSDSSKREPFPLVSALCVLLSLSLSLSQKMKRELAVADQNEETVALPSALLCSALVCSRRLVHIII